MANIKIVEHVVQDLPSERPLVTGHKYKVMQSDGTLIEYVINSQGEPVRLKGITNDESSRLNRLSSEQISKVESITTEDISKLKEDYTRAEVDQELNSVRNLANSSRINLNGSTVLPVPPTRPDSSIIEDAWARIAQNVTYTQAGGSPLTGIDGHETVAEWNNEDGEWVLVDMGELPTTPTSDEITPEGEVAVSQRGVYNNAIVLKDSTLYEPGSDYISGEYLIDGVVTLLESAKRTDFLSIQGGKSIILSGRTSYYTSVFIFNSDKLYLQTIEIVNGQIDVEEIDAQAAFIVFNLRVQESDNDNSLTATVILKRFEEIHLLNHKIEEVSEKSVPKANEESFNVADNAVSGVMINGDTGLLQDSTVASIIPFINISDASKITLSDFPTGLNAKWFYDVNKNPISRIDINNGEITRNIFPQGSVYFSFNVKTANINLDLLGSVNILRDYVDVKIKSSGVAFSDEVYRRKYIDILKDNIIEAEAFTSSGTINTNVPGSARTGYLRIEDGLDIEFKNIVDGFFSKIFFDSSFNIISIVSINNGVLSSELIPEGAMYVGFNVKNLQLGGDPNVVEAYSFIDDIRGLDSEEFNGVLSIPSIIPVAVGVQANVYYDNIRSNPVNDKTELFLHEGSPITSTRSNPYIYKTYRTERALQYSPSQPGETVTVSARLRDKNYKILKDKRFQFVSVSPDIGAGNNYNIILAGDSQVDTVYDGAKTSFAPFLKHMTDSDAGASLNYIGSEIMSETIFYGDSPEENINVNCGTEGYGGRQITWFLESTSPFWNSSKPGGAGLDFINYMDSKGMTGQDLHFFVFPMGVNDFNAGVPTPEIIDRMKAMQSAIWEDFPDCKFIVGMVTQGSKFWSMDVRRKWNIEYYDALIQEFEKNEYDGKVYLCPAGLMTDNIYGSRQIRPFSEPYSRIVDSKNLLIKKLIQSGLSEEDAIYKVEVEYGLKVEERGLTRWLDEYPGTTDIVHSSWVSAMQQADAYYSTIKYAISQN